MILRIVIGRALMLDDVGQGDQAGLTDSLGQSFFGQRAMRPLPSSNGWMLTKYRCAMPARMIAGKAMSPSGAVAANHAKNRCISVSMADDGGASKCTFGLCSGPETTCIGSL